MYMYMCMCMYMCMYAYMHIVCIDMTYVFVQGLLFLGEVASWLELSKLHKFLQGVCAAGFLKFLSCALWSISVKTVKDMDPSQGL